MSNTEWIDKTPLPDNPATRDLSDATGATEPDLEVGAWPEETNIRYVADGNLTIPGVGTQPDRDGTWVPKTFCSPKGHVNFGPYECGSRECPEHWTDWVSESANRITRRLAAARQAEPHGIERRAVHAVASPAPGHVKTIEQFHEMKKEAYTLAREKGIRGGVAIAHGWRVKEDYKDLFGVLKQQDKIEGGIWSWIRKNDRDWRVQTYWSPHVHIFGLSEDTGPNNPADDGWVFKRIRTLSNFKIRQASSYRDMIGLAFYILSHATFDPQNSKQAVRWFGSLYTAGFSPEKDLGLLELDSNGHRVMEIDVIEQMTDTVQYSADDEDGHTCDVCGSEDVHDIWSAGDALQDERWCNSIGRENEKRLNAAYKWRIGDLQPPPGLANPTDAEQAEETLQSML